MIELILIIVGLFCLPLIVSFVFWLVAGLSGLLLSGVWDWLEQLYAKIPGDLFALVLACAVWSALLDTAWVWVGGLVGWTILRLVLPERYFLQSGQSRDVRLSRDGD
jgi:hypothetical protein